MPDTPNLPIFLGADCVVLTRDEYMKTKPSFRHLALLAENERFRDGLRDIIDERITLHAEIALLRSELSTAQSNADACAYRLQQFLDLAENFRDA